MKLKTYTSVVLATICAAATPASAQNRALLLFDGKTGTQFAGCLNCMKSDESSVCNKYGDYGSKYNDKSIWNKYGKFGSKYEDNSPWNKYGSGLRIVDESGNYYGRLSLSKYDQSRVPIAQGMVKAYVALDDLEALRKLLCDQE